LDIEAGGRRTIRRMSPIYIDFLFLVFLLPCTPVLLSCSLHTRTSFFFHSSPAITIVNQRVSFSARQPKQHISITLSWLSPRLESLYDSFFFLLSIDNYYNHTRFTEKNTAKLQDPLRRTHIITTIEPLETNPSYFFPFILHVPMIIYIYISTSRN
jgi:hypothetical protein